MKYYLSIILVSLAACVCAQQTCQVATRAIQGKYIGGCKKGFADGEGTATGLYTYTGEFKKGFPNGKGTITWNEDSMYVGGWKKGEMSGKGMLVVRGDTTE